MKTILLAAVAALAATTAYAQDAARPSALDVDIPGIPGVTHDPTCGGRAPLAQQAYCLQTTQTAIATQVDVFTADFARQGWLAASGENNRVVYVRRRPAGGCDAFQMLAFSDEAPGRPAWLAFAPIPGDVCAAHPGAGQ